MTETLALRIDKEDFWNVLDNSSAIAVGIVKELVARYVPQEDTDHLR